MTLPVKIPAFQKAPDKYDPSFIDNLVKELRLYMQLVNAVGDVKVGGVHTSGLPESEDGSGLRPGTFYRDSNGFVKVAL